MIGTAEVEAIIAQYAKHGWVLRRALLSSEAKASLGAAVGAVPVFESDIDALWFSRSSKPNTESWELRRLTGTPFALVAVVSTEAPSEELESTLTQVVDDMREKRIA